MTSGSVALDRWADWMRCALREPAPLSIPLHATERRSAVLLPILVRADGLRLLFVKKSEKLRRHAGQVAFPGGAVDAADASAEAAALREAFEEVGLAPDAVELLGALDDERTYVTGYHIQPVVGLVRAPPPAWTLDAHEIEAVLEIPLAVIEAAEPVRWLQWELEGAVHRAPVFELDGTTVWGASARILWNLQVRLRQSAWADGDDARPRPVRSPPRTD
ncbi:MAG: CoA pyrophosphatase [Myxococcales bacterium]|nr:CoA pyrophosphatase [Myxococcales bacterium]